MTNKPALNLRMVALAALLAATCGGARAALFEDDEARRAILELRNRIGQLERTNTEQGSSLRDEVQQLRRQLVDLNNQLELMRAEEAKLRGLNEQLARDVSELQRGQKDVRQGIDERLRKFEPQQVTVDGKTFNADPDEKRQYDEALAPLRNGDFNSAATLLSNFLQRYPRSGYVDSARFWLGNAQYGKRDYKDAIATFKAFIAGNPDHPRAAEAQLALANCQIELKDNKAARRTLDDLIKSYPGTEAAQAAKERLAALR